MIKKIAFFILAISSYSLATSYTANSSGNWTTSTIWTPNGVPGVGDTININGNTVTVISDTIIGTSGSSTTVAVTLGTGTIHVTGGNTIHLRGNVTFDPGSASTFILDAGSGYEWDGSHAASTATATYSYYPTASFATRPFTVNGTSSSIVNITSNNGGGAGFFWDNNLSPGRIGNYQITYAYLKRIGDGTNPSFQINDGTTGFTAWNVTHSTFDTCGGISAVSTGFGSSMQIIHNYNTHINTQSTSIFYPFWIALNSPSGPNLRQLKYNVFDKYTGDSFTVTGYDVTNNYFANEFLFGSNGVPNSFTYNLFRTPQVGDSGHGSPNVVGNIYNTYFFADTDVVNEHYMTNVASSSGSIVSGCIAGRGGTDHGDSGEFIADSATNGGPITLQNSIALMNAEGKADMEFTSIEEGVGSTGSWIIDHNTEGMYYNTNSFNPSSAFGCVDVNEGVAFKPGVLTFTNSICWSPIAATGGNLNYYKIGSISVQPSSDVCNANNCNYNGGWNYAVPFSTNGYMARWTNTPGLNDVNQDPNFIDYKRTLELFDYKYLGNHPAFWNSGASYVAGNQVSFTDPTLYWGSTVTFTYINDATCAGTNPSPWTGVNWRDCWEWTTLSDVRAQVVSTTTYTDATIGANGDGIIPTIIKWVKQGYTPQNTAYFTSAKDGTTIGAIQVSTGSIPVIKAFNASPAVIQSGNSLLLSWNVAFATSVFINNGIGYVTALGSTTVSPSSSIIYTLTAFSNAGDSVQSSTITVIGQSIGSGSIIRGNALILGHALIIGGGSTVVASSTANYMNIGNMDNSLIGWTRITQGAPGVTMSTDSYSGQFSSEFVGANGVGFEIASNYIPISSNTQYTISLYAKCPSDTSIPRIFSYDDIGQNAIGTITCDGTWHNNILNFTTDVGAKYSFFYISSFNQFYVEIDNVVMTNPDGTAPPHTVQHSGNRNVTISSQTVIVDGTNYFMLGYSEVPYDQLSTAAVQGANTIYGFGKTANTDVFNISSTSYPDTIYNLGMNYVPDSTNGARTSRSAVGIPAMANIAATYGHHLANIVWQLADEPDFYDVLPDEYITTGTLVAQYNAMKPILSVPITNDFQHSYFNDGLISTYSLATDIWMAEPYGDNFSGIDNATSLYNSIKTAPIWIFDSSVSTGSIVPKAWYAVIRGVTGIVYFSYNDYYSSQFQGAQSSWTLTSQAFNEIKPLTAAITGTYLNSNITSTPSNVAAAMRNDGSHNYMFSVHNDTHTVTGTIAVTGLSPGTTITVLYESRTVTSGAGTIPDTWTGISRHIYKW